MGVPGQSKFADPIVDELNKAGGKLTSEEIISRITVRRFELFPDMTTQDFQQTDSTGRKFDHRIHSELQMLKKRGVVDHSGGKGDLWSLVILEPKTGPQAQRQGAQLVQPPVLAPTPAPAPALPASAMPSSQPGADLQDIIERLGRPSSESGIQMQDLIRRNEERVKVSLREQLQNMSPQGFEHFVGRLLEAIGFSDVQVTGRTGDGGIDGLCKQRTLEMDVPFQAKHWTNNPVRFPQVAEFRGGRAARYERGIYVTTSRFTDDAKALKDEPGGPRLILIDGEKLVELMMEKRLGVEEKPLTYWQVNEDFFSQFK